VPGEDAAVPVEERTGPIALVLPRPDWIERAASLAEAIEAVASTRVVRVDHIGSTSVPGMLAKDVVDVQAVVSSLEPRRELADVFESIELRAPFGLDGAVDHVPTGWVGDEAQWQKMVFSGEHAGGRCHVHVRVEGSANARYAVLFRDYLRANEPARDSWVAFKRRLADVAADLEEYGWVKDAATDVLMLAAERWAEEAGWVPGRGAQ
jgi:GrpB-like predicted nucleotidyltransferase (UPF0157 family)